jgi:KaiC/GvpD/RAD55 family RecA-like ATPase
LIAPTVRAYGADLKIKDLVEFVDFHHNIMIFANSESRKTVRELANEFGVDFEDYGYTM